MTRKTIAILDDYTKAATRLADWSVLPHSCRIDVFSDHLADPEALIERLSGYDALVVIRERTPLPGAILRRLPRLRLIVTFGIANQSIDMEAAADCGIEVVGTLPSSLASTTEQTWGLILGLSRRIAANDGAMRRGLWQTDLSIELAGRSLGVVGLGSLGVAVARIGQVFGMRVLAWSPNLTPQRCADAGVEGRDLDTLLGEADVVSLHLRLSETTRGLIGARELALMKPGAFLVNTARGPLLDEAALIAALDEGQIAGAGLDVYETEPLPGNHPLRGRPDVLLSPHMGFTTREGFERHFTATVARLQDWLAGQGS